MDKQTLRATYLSKRKGLIEEVYLRYNKEVKENFISFLVNRQINYLHTFLPIVKNKEVDTWPIIDWAKAKGIKVVISKSDLADNLLTHLLYEKKSQLMNNRWGIPEPQGGTIIPEEKIDLVLIPLLIFDRQGHRVGYGKGYYDRFLAGCRPDTLKVGLSLFSPIDRIADINKQDIKLDYCITPQGVINF